MENFYLTVHEAHFLGFQDPRNLVVGSATPIYAICSDPEILRSYGVSSSPLGFQLIATSNSSGMISWVLQTKMANS